MKVDLLQRINSTIKIPWKDKLISFDPIMKAPKIKLPMYKHLSSRSVDLMIPGLGKLERNTLVLLEENRKFIESYMVGLNHEMGRELVWREFPTDQRGTIFSYFWDSTQSKDPPADIKEIHEWNKKLGKNRIEQKNIVENKLVLAIKADLIRRYPNTIIFAIKKEKNTRWDEVFNKIDKDDSKGNNSFSVCHPIFSANIGVDVLFLGFPFSENNIQDDAKKGYEYYFIFMEHPSLPRFGLDESNTQVRMITDYDGNTKAATVDTDWGTLPDNNFVYCVSIEGTVLEGTATTVKLPNNASSINRAYNGMQVEIVKGIGIGQVRKITDYDGNTKVATVDSDWETVPDNTSVYRLSVEGMAQGGTKTTIILANDASTIDDAYDRMYIEIVSLDLDNSWDNLSWYHVKFVQDSSRWIDANSLKSDLRNKPTSPAWGANSASTAWITFQKPVRIVFPAKKLLEKN